jgi:hypothetical protein
MSDRVGGYADPKPGGFILNDPGTGGLKCEGIKVGGSHE